MNKRSYPGRIIIIGKDRSDHHVITIYAITGRSCSSQAREIIYSQGKALVKPTDRQKIQKGKPDLLIYPALRIGKGIVVSNGKHTDDIYKNINITSHPVETLAAGLKSWHYESDPPNYTPRISGCILSEEKAALSIIKRADNGRSLKNFYEFPLISGKGKMISTYEGQNKDPLPSFKGEPVDIEINTAEADEAAQYIYHSLKPKTNQPDFRVALICVFSQKTRLQKNKVSIINRHKRRK